MKNHEPGTATRVITLAMVTSVILLLVLVVVLVLFHIYIVLREFNRGTDNVNMAERGSTSMSKEDIEKLPCFVFQAKEKGISSPMDCAICLDNFKVGDKCRILPQCDHSFHAECIDLWLLKVPLCPMCRAGANIPRDCSISIGESSGYSERGRNVALNEQFNRTVSGDGQMRQELS